MPFQEKREKYIRVVLVHGNERLLFFFQLEWPRCVRRHPAEGGATTGERGKNYLESGNDSMLSVDEYGAILGKK